MKVILKGGSEEKNKEIERFFLIKIFPILNFGIAIEKSNRKITVFEKKNGEIVEYIDPTAEVIVELPLEAINIIKSGGTAFELAQVSGDFYDEAVAIRAIERLRPNFSIEYYSCRYTAARKQ